MKNIKSAFKMPNAVKITGRTSSITNSFVNGIIPVINPSESEINKALEILEMTPETVCCAYCGDAMTEWDHFRPLVVDKQPTGYITEIHNLVPACSKCNQSKGNSNWETWMRGSAKQSPATRRIKDMEHRIELLRNYEKWDSPKYPTRIDIQKIIGDEKWKKHWDNCNEIKRLMNESQALSNEIQNDIKKSIGTIKTNTSLSVEKTQNNNVSKKGDVKISQIVKTEFVELLQSSNCSSTLLNNLCDANFSKKVFNVNYPILIEISTPEDLKKRFDKKGCSRYYITEYYFNGKFYLLTSEWYERNKEKLINWIKQEK